MTSSEIPRDEAFLTACRRIGSSTWSDALDEFGIDGVIRGLPQRSGEGRIAGFAVTVRERVEKRGTFSKSELGVGKIFSGARAGDVLVFDMGGADVSTFGGLAAIALTKNLVTGVIIDGGCRDLGEIRASGLWLAARYVTPTTGKTRARVEAVGEPVTVGGVRVHHGDLIIADETGIVAVPKADIERVKTMAEEKLATDLAVEKGLAAGEDFAAAASKAKYL